MGPILLLTKNVLAEVEIQDKLQHLNYEVFSSSSILTKKISNVEFLQFVNFYSYTIISETIADIELQQMLPVLQNSKTTLIRKCGHPTETEPGAPTNLCISNESSIEELRDLLIRNKITNHFATSGGLVGTSSLSSTTNVDHVFTVDQLIEELRLSRLERKTLEVLHKANRAIVTREDLCTKMWAGGITTSRLVMLSTLIRKVKEKLQNSGFPEDSIRTHWGQGYQLTQRFYDYLGIEPLVKLQKKEPLPQSGDTQMTT